MPLMSVKGRTCLGVAMPGELGYLGLITGHMYPAWKDDGGDASATWLAQE